MRRRRTEVQGHLPLGTAPAWACWACSSRCQPLASRNPRRLLPRWSSLADHRQNAPWSRCWWRCASTGITRHPTRLCSVWPSSRSGSRFGPDTVALVSSRLRDSGRFADVDVRKRYRSLSASHEVVLVIVVTDFDAAEPGDEDHQAAVVEPAPDVEPDVPAGARLHRWLRVHLRRQVHVCWRNGAHGTALRAVDVGRDQAGGCRTGTDVRRRRCHAP